MPERKPATALVQGHGEPDQPAHVCQEADGPSPTCDSPHRVPNPPGRPGAGAGRFTPRGLMRRRRPVTHEEGWYVRPATPRAVGEVLRLPKSPLPPGLLPLPRGFEPAR